MEYKLRSSAFLGTEQRQFLTEVAGQSIHTIFKGQFFFSRPLKMGPIGCPETSVRNYYSLRNNLEGLSYNQLRGGSLKSRKRNVGCGQINLVHD